MTRSDFLALFDGLGVRGTQVVVHTALSSFGEVEGGARTLCEALIDAVTESGTVVMPAFTCTETLRPAAERGQARPVAFHLDLAVSREVGAVAETFRHVPGVLRSSHPSHSFAAWGRQAREVLSTQRDNNPLGPLKKLNVAQGQVLLLGTSLAVATVIHLAEERAPVPYLGRCTAVRINAAGYDERVVLENVPGCGTAFVKMDGRLDPAKVKRVALPNGVARKMPIRYLVNLAAKMIEADPRVFVCDDSACASCAVKRDAIGEASTSAVG